MNNKPIFHITGEKGWINDPNGVVKFLGQYHVFFQHHPYSNEWGPMHWGHVVSDDLMHWKYLPYALTPGDSFDKDGCFSGTSLVVGDTLYIVYTGFINNEDPEKIQQIQCLASSKDGVHFTKHGAIITGKDLPSEYKPCDFRDPKLFYKDGFYYLLVATRRVNNGGAIVLYKSIDLKKWTFVSDVLTHKSEGEMIECADYHEDLGLLIYCEQNFPSDNNHCLNIHSCEYELGAFNKDYKFIPSSKKTLIDYGFDFYAPQIMDKEHILIAWLNMWDRNIPSSKYGFAGMLTVSRKVYVEDNLMLQTPIIYGQKVLEESFEKEYEGELSVGTIELDIENLKSFSFEFRKGTKETTKLYLKDDKIYFDRSESGETITGAEVDEYSKKGIRIMPYRKLNHTKIYIVLDKYSIEVFVNGLSMSNTIYPSEKSEKFTLKIESGCNRLSLYK